MSIPGMGVVEDRRGPGTLAGEPVGTGPFDESDGADETPSSTEKPILVSMYTARQKSRAASKKTPSSQPRAGPPMTNL